MLNATRTRCLLAMGVAMLVTGGSLKAQTLPATREAAPALVVVQKLRDAGGLPGTEKGKPSLNDNLTTAVVRYLEERKPLFAVWDGRRREPIPHVPGQKSLTVEGDLSRMAADVPTQDIYLLTIRLFEEGSPRRIVAQWSGRARSLIYLTNNLHHAPNFSPSGLLGEMGDRIIVTSSACCTPSHDEAEQKFKQLLTKVPNSREMQTSVLTEMVGPGNPLVLKPLAADTPLVSGAYYQLEVSSSVPGSVYVVRSGDKGEVSPLWVPEEGKEKMVGPGSPLRFPYGGHWKATATGQPISEEIVVLLRHRVGSASAVQPAHVDAVQTVRQISLEQDIGSPASFSQRLGLAEELDVQVIDAGNRLLPRNAPDPDLMRLSHLIETDAPGTWGAIRIRFAIEPAKSS